MGRLGGGYEYGASANLRRPGDGVWAVVELLSWHDAMDQADLQRARCRDPFAEQEDLDGRAEADEPRQPEGGAAHRAHRTRHAHVAELGVGRGDPEVAGER